MLAHQTSTFKGSGLLSAQCTPTVIRFPNARPVPLLLPDLLPFLYSFLSYFGINSSHIDGSYSSCAFYGLKHLQDYKVSFLSFLENNIRLINNSQVLGPIRSQTGFHFMISYTLLLRQIRGQRQREHEGNKMLEKLIQILNELPLGTRSCRCWNLDWNTKCCSNFAGQTASLTEWTGDDLCQGSFSNSS